MSNTRESVSSHFQKLRKRVENTKDGGAFLTNFEVFGNVMKHSFSFFPDNKCTSFLFSLDSTSLGYNSGQGALSCTDPPLRNSHTGLLQTCDFLADISPGRKKSLDFEKRSTYSVSMSSSASEGRGAYRSRFSLPHVCVYVAWFGCVMTACIASVFTVWYGVR